MRQWINLVETALNEGTSENLFRKNGGKIMPFDQLPESAQKALSQYLGEYDAEESFKNANYGYVLIPAKQLVKACWNAPDNEMKNDHKNWNEYHEDYWSSEKDAKYKNHLSGMWPVLLDDGEGILDGWHRMHWYLRNKVSLIPAIWFAD